MSRTTLTYGTAYFKTRTHALIYYARTAECKLTNIEYVQGKIDRGEIYIGRPPNSPGVVKCYADDDGRYHQVVSYSSPA